MSSSSDAMSSGYSANLLWCRRCDVGWNGPETTCWLCGRGDDVWKWGWESHHPVLRQLEVR